MKNNMATATARHKGISWMLPVAIVLIVLVAVVVGYTQYTAHVTQQSSPETTILTNPETTPAPQITIPTITVTSAPSSAEVGVPFTVSWKIDSDPMTIGHTAIHYDYSSHPGTLDASVTPSSSGYVYLTNDYTTGQYQIPNTFSASITPAQAGTIYFRAHAIIGNKNYWSDEKTITVTAPQTPQPSPIKQFAVEADDYGFYMNGQRTASITVVNGDVVKITFMVRTTNVYHSGLDFRGYGQNAGAPPGGTAVLQFTANSNGVITSYWPSTNIAKQNLDIIIPSGGTSGTGGGY